MKKGSLKETLPFGRGIIIIAVIIPVTLSFILGYFVGKSTTSRENPEMKQLQEIQSNTTLPIEAQSQQQAQSQVSEPSAGQDIQPAESQKAAKDLQQSQKPAAVLYTVQVGAFKNAADADALKKKLEKKGYRTSMALSESKKEGGLYKIWVGKFSTRKQAEALSIKIKKTEGLQAFVTVKKEESIRQP